MHTSLTQFHPVIGRWFEEKLGLPTPPQTLGWPVIGAGKSALILAPTGSGKTLAAFLAAIDWLARRLVEAQEKLQPLMGVQILYVSPLKSLANDIQKNLLRPLAEIADGAAATGITQWPEITVAVRTGDTPAKDRAAILRRPPHILITTPESLNLMLTSGARGVLATARYLIVDEVHALAGSKRGVFLALLLERLEEERRLLAGIPPGGGKHGTPPKGLKIAPGVYIPVEPLQPLVRIGLSATARPEETIAAWLAGLDDEGKPRPIQVIRSGQRKRLDLQVICPFGGAGGNEASLEDEPEFTMPEPRNRQEKHRGVGHWPEVTRSILTMIREHRSTLVFGNSRRLIERLAARFQDEQLAEADLAQKHPDRPPPAFPTILPHHGSISKEVRLETEQALKRGEVDAVLATSSLELGIDIGALDLVVQIDSPGNIAAGLQRVGRAGHLEKATAKGRMIARGLYELPSFAGLVPLMFEGVVEETRIPENCLDVLAQQIVAACVPRPWKRAVLYAAFKRAMPYRHLSEKQFDAVVAMLSKRAERVTAQGLRPRISFDRINDELIILPSAAKVVLVNSGVIADTGQFPVYLLGSKKGRIELSSPESMAPREAAQQKWGGDGNAENSTGPGIRLGELDEEFVYETKEGDRIILGSQTWKIVRIDADRVLVEPSAPGSSRMPFWRGENAPRSELLGDAVAAFNADIERRLAAESDDTTHAHLTKNHHFDDQAADNTIAFYRRQLSKGAVPTDTSIVIEHFTDRTGEPIIAILTPLGSRVNYALRLALEGQFQRRRLPAQLVHSDDGIIIRPPVEVGEIPENPLAWLRSGTLEQEITDQLEATALFGLRFRQNAARALMLPRMTLTQRTPLWQQRLRARHLLALVKQQRNFPIIVETYRECLQDALNIPRVARLLQQIETGACSIKIVRQQGNDSSPFARSLFSQFTQTYLYEQDDPFLPQDLQPAVDQHILDEILQRRGSGDESASGRKGESVKGWDPADEELLRRRIHGTDYPARTSEELLEKIEATGAVGVPYALDDPRWSEWAVGGLADAQHMLADLAERRRVLLATLNPSKPRRKAAKAPFPQSPSLSRWLATDNLALLLTARGGEAVTLHRLDNRTPVPLDESELPPALLHSDLTVEDAQRLLIEQALKRDPVTTRDAVAADLPWLAKDLPAHLDALLQEGRLQEYPASENEPPHLVWSEYADQLRTFALRRQRRLAATVDLAALQRHLLRWQHVSPAPSPGSPGASSHAANALEQASIAPLDRLEDTLDLFTGLAFPLDFWDHELLPTRVPTFSPAMLDGIAKGGHRVWVAMTTPDAPADETPIAFWPRHLLSQRPAPASDAPPLSPLAQKLLEHLAAQGASFFFDLQLALNLDDADLALALRELAARGFASSDDLESLRQVLRLTANATRDRSRAPAPPRLHATHPRHVPRPSRLPRQWWKNSSGTMASTTAGNLGGRWFLLPPPSTSTNPLDLAERAADRVDRLLRRTAFACRELLEPALDGTWRDAYDVLTRMEWAGTVRRGYFVDGIQGSQFALPAARFDPSSSAAEVTWLATLDPANIWTQASTRWISDAGLAARVARAPGNWVALIDGRPVLAATNWGNRLIPLPAPEEQQRLALQTVAALFPRLPRNSHPYLQVRYWDQQEIAATPAADVLRQQGFARDTQGLRLYRQYQTV